MILRGERTTIQDSPFLRCGGQRLEEGLAERSRVPLFPLRGTRLSIAFHKAPLGCSGQDEKTRL